MITGYVRKLLNKFASRQSSDFTVQAAPFDYKAVVARAIQQPFFDTVSPAYGSELQELLQVRVRPVPNLQAGQWYWKAICGYFLTMQEGGGNPNIYLFAVNESGLIEHPQTTGRTICFGWTWEGKRPDERADPVCVNKPTNEPPTNINLGRWQIASTWVIDDIPSETIWNLRTDRPEGVFHGGTLAGFQKVQFWPGTVDPDPDPDPPPPDPIVPGDWLAWKAHIEAEQARQAAAIERIKSKLREAGQ